MIGNEIKDDEYYDLVPDAKSGIEGYWEGKIKQAGIFADCVEAKDVWYEWNMAIGCEHADDEADECINENTDLSGWTI
jgi:hypothetical protein